METDGGAKRQLYIDGTDETAAGITVSLEAHFLANRRRLEQFLAIRLGSRQDAQDAAQSVFVRLWRRRASLTDDNVTALLFVTARNIATDILRERARHRTTSIETEAGQAGLRGLSSEADSPQRIAAARDHLTLIVRIIEELPPKCRQAFSDCRLHGLSYGETAARMGITESMVRKYVLRAVAYCAARFDNLEGWE